MANAAVFEGVIGGNMRRVHAALAAGASVNGSPELPGVPIMVATTRDNVDMVNLLILQGADPEIPADHEMSCPNSDFAVRRGERALHLAAKRGNVDIACLLLKRARANPNATDQTGRTPLMAACATLHNYAALVRLLLEAGADPALAEEDGFIALHVAAQKGRVDLIDMLYAGAPATLNTYSSDGETPLFAACTEGREGTVSRLLSLGARQRVPPDDRNMCPLLVAAILGFSGVVRILVDDGLRAVGGTGTLSMGLNNALLYRNAKAVRLLLAADGEEKRSRWANIIICEKSLLYRGAADCCPAVVSALLAAGADEAARDSEGRLPRDVIGVDLLPEDLPMDRREEAAIRRMLEQGPAYRARSWAWPAEEVEHAGGCGDDADAVVSSPAAAPKVPVGVRIFRPKGDMKFFVSAVGRYCEKD